MNKNEILSIPYFVVYNLMMEWKQIMLVALFSYSTKNRHAKVLLTFMRHTNTLVNRGRRYHDDRTNESR